MWLAYFLYRLHNLRRYDSEWNEKREKIVTPFGCEPKRGISAPVAKSVYRGNDSRPNPSSRNLGRSSPLLYPNGPRSFSSPFALASLSLVPLLQDDKICAVGRIC